jgi:uncharacterized protein YbjT (DUF2867 family)
MSTEPQKPDLICLTGATGYVGGRLGAHLLEAGYRVRCLVRSAAKLDARPWSRNPHVECREVDLLNPEALTESLRGCVAAYYMVHSMQAVGSRYAGHDILMARTFAEAAARAGVKRIIYLGGLGELGDDLSEHLSSRRDVEEALACTSVPVTVLRAAMIIGSGSASFEILRYLVDRLPVMVTPRWVKTESQPIAIRNVLHYLVACLRTPETAGMTLDIGGPDVMTYRELMRTMTDAQGLPRRLIIPVPVLTPRLSSLWVHLVTPVGYRMARPLAEGLRNRVVCRDNRAAELMPQPLLSVREAIDAALIKVKRDDVETAWSDSGAIPGDPDWAGGKVFVDERRAIVNAPPKAVFDAVCKVGGGHGYYAADRLWRLRGLMDKLLGGPGLRRGRRHPQKLSVGDALDFWRVSAVDPPMRLRLIAEMKLPGKATLEFTINPADATAPDEASTSNTLTQTARFRPAGLLGLLYWYAVLPLHHMVFSGMLRGICLEAVRNEPGQNK